MWRKCILLVHATFHQYLTADQIVQRYALSDAQQQQVVTG